MLEVKDLYKAFGEVTALDGCSLTVRRGQMLGLLGPNGAGKTTTMRAIFGLVRADRGKVTWDDSPIDKRVRRGFGYMPEERGLYPKLEVKWQLVYLGRLHGMEHSDAAAAAERWLEEFDLLDRADARLSELSHGNQQRVQLIAALLHKPELIILDEPFSGLDPIASEFMASVLARLAGEGAGIVFSSHQLDVVEDLCEQVIIMHKGRVVIKGIVTELRAASDDRYVETAGENLSWMTRLEGSEVVERSDGHVRVHVPGGSGFADIAALASEAGVTQFTYEPPPLSEVFRKAIDG